jgi:hypothetical protein
LSVIRSDRAVDGSGVPILGGFDSLAGVGIQFGGGGVSSNIKQGPAR